MRFDGKTIVVTGGALGIGGAVCEILAERGAAVSILDWDENAGIQTCLRIEQAGGRAIFQKGDVSDAAAILWSLVPVFNVTEPPLLPTTGSGKKCLG